MPTTWRREPESTSWPRTWTGASPGPRLAGSRYTVPPVAPAGDDAAGGGLLPHRRYARCDVGGHAGSSPDMRESVRRLLLGPPLPSDRESSERVSNPLALAALSSDALSSVAYATEEMLKILVPVAGVAAYRLSLPIAGAVVGLLCLLVLSYRQTIKAYPNAGGAYIVTRDNFGLVPAQAAGMALLVDYVMTVAVSISAAVAALYSYFPSLFSVRVVLAVACIWLVAWGNLRGVRAAGRTFALPP